MFGCHSPSLILAGTAVMSALFPFVPNRFASTAATYARYRIGYADGLIDRALVECRLGAGARALDLGAGPGLLAIPLARRGIEVLALDPDAAMLEAGRADPAAADLAIDWRQGSSYDLPGDFGAFDLVTIGRAFHWMDRAATLAALDAMVKPGGAIALFTDDRIRGIKNASDQIVEEVRIAAAGREDVFSGMRSGAVIPHETMLLDSPFRSLVRIGVVETRAVSVEDIVGRALTYSHCAPAALGDGLPAVVALLRRRLEAAAVDGVLTEVVEHTAIIARRA
jgi:SAM-dependent methyltransferase